MNWVIEYIETGNYVRVIFTGVFNIEENLAFTQNLISSPFWKPGTNLLFDKRNFEYGQINIKTLRKTSLYYENFTSQFGSGKIAILMNSFRNYGIGRQIEMLFENKLQRKIQVFMNEHEALEWLIQDGQI